MSGGMRTGVRSAFFLSAALLALLSLFGRSRPDSSRTAESRISRSADEEPALFIG